MLHTEAAAASVSFFLSFFFWLCSKLKFFSDPFWRLEIYSNSHKTHITPREGPADVRVVRLFDSSLKLVFCNVACCTCEYPFASDLGPSYTGYM